MYMPYLCTELLYINYTLSAAQIMKMIFCVIKETELLFGQGDDLLSTPAHTYLPIQHMLQSYYGSGNMCHQAWGGRGVHARYRMASR